MDFYLTEIKANNQEGTKIHFPMNPEKVDVSKGVTLQSFSVMALGEVAFPNGNRLDTIAWEGKLPGEARKNMSFVKDWQDPTQIYNTLVTWKQTGARLRLLVTGSTINIDVFIEQLNPQFGSALGDIDYNIGLTEYKDLKVYLVGETTGSTATKGSAVAKRATKPKSKTYTVKQGDSLWKIAEKQLGNGSRYPEIQALSKPPVGANPAKIYPGQVLTLPT